MGKSKTLIAIVVIVLIAAGVFTYFYLRPKPEETTTATPQEPTAEGVQPEEIEPIHVELSKSDEVVRDLVKGLSSRPEVARWLLTDNLIRRFVAATDMIANGNNPKVPADFIEVKGDFRVSEQNGQVFIDPKSYRRYDRIAEIIGSLDTDGIVTLYKKMRLPIQQAYRELGYPDENFNSTFKKAILSLLETPVVEDRIYLKKDVLTYTMKNPELEDLSPAQKHLLRMGPDNMRVIQAKLEDIAFKLGFLN